MKLGYSSGLGSAAMAIRLVEPPPPPIASVGFTRSYTTGTGVEVIDLDALATPGIGETVFFDTGLPAGIGRSGSRISVDTAVVADGASFRVTRSDDAGVLAFDGVIGTVALDWADGGGDGSFVLRYGTDGTGDISVALSSGTYPAWDGSYTFSQGEQDLIEAGGAIAKSAPVVGVLSDGDSSGSPTVGDILGTETPALFFAGSDVTPTRQWQRDTGSGFADIAGATAASFDTTGETAGHAFRRVDTVLGVASVSNGITLVSASAFDTFTVGADTDLLSYVGESGESWALEHGSYGTSLGLVSAATGRLGASDTNGSKLVSRGSVFYSDCYVEGTCVRGSGSSNFEGIGLALRVDGSSGYYGYYDHGADQFRFIKKVAGSDTVLGSFAPPPAFSVTGDAVTFRLEAEGTDIRAFIDGLLMATYSDSALASGKIGVRMYGQTSSGEFSELSDFNGGAL